MTGRQQPKISVPKDENILSKLRQKAAQGFSPSTLSVYVNCPLQFYFSVIAGLEEPEEPAEVVDAPKFGTIVHDVLETLYLPYKGKIIKPEDIKTMKKQAQAQVLNSFAKHYNRDEVRFGKNRLIFNVAGHYVIKMLDHEANDCRHAEILISELEQKLEYQFPLDLNGESLSVKVKGKADRIDQKAGLLRIIDYKTGKVEPKELKFNETEELFIDPELSKAFQLHFYGFLYAKQNRVSSSFSAGIISLRSMNKGFMPLTQNDNHQLTPEMVDLFEKHLKELISELFDTEEQFAQTEEPDNCKYCPFVNICNR